MPDRLEPFDRSRALRGRDLRHAALVVLHRSARPFTVSEIVAALRDVGFTVAGNSPGKSLADGLRHEVTRGRARRVGWGRYTIGYLPRTTAWRIGQRMDRSPHRAGPTQA